MESSYKITVTVKTKYQCLFSRYISLMRQQWTGITVQLTCSAGELKTQDQIPFLIRQRHM